jgi:integrase
MTRKNLTDHAHAAALEGSYSGASNVLMIFGDSRLWTDETRRARWDGAASLLRWWHEQDEMLRPPLDNLSKEDTQGFITSLERRGLARSTIQGYRVGASALTKALRAMRTLPVKFDPSYDPFAQARPTPVKKPLPKVPKEKLTSIASPHTRARLELLLALLALGMTVPEVCGRKWHDVTLKGRLLYGYRKRFITLGVPAVRAIEQLLKVQPHVKPEGCKWMLGWNADTARRWLNKVSTSEDS